jgi:hypothetical protein
VPSTGGHLIAKEYAFKVTVGFSNAYKNLEMAITDNSHARRRWSPFKARVIAVLAGFGILHVVGGYMLHDAPSIRSIETATTAIHGD